MRKASEALTRKLRLRTGGWEVARGRVGNFFQADRRSLDKECRGGVAL